MTIEKTVDPGVHEGDCAWVRGGLTCEQCEDFENRLGEKVGHPEACSYTMKATSPEIIAHLRGTDRSCGGFWPDVTAHLSLTYGLTEERVRELRNAPRDPDGWPIGMSLTQPEYYMVQDSGDGLQETREKLATSDAIDFLVGALRSRHDVRPDTVDRGEDYVSFDHDGHHFTAEVALDKDAS